MSVAGAGETIGSSLGDGDAADSCLAGMLGLLSLRLPTESRGLLSGLRPALTSSFHTIVVDVFRFRKRGGVSYLGGGHLGTYVPPSEGEEGESGRNLQNNVTSFFVLLEFNKNQKGPGRLGN